MRLLPLIMELLHFTTQTVQQTMIQTRALTMRLLSLIMEQLHFTTQTVQKAMLQTWALTMRLLPRTMELLHFTTQTIHQTMLQTKKPVDVLVFIVIGRSCSEGCGFDSHCRLGSFLGFNSRPIMYGAVGSLVLSWSWTRQPGFISFWCLWIQLCNNLGQRLCAYNLTS